MDAFNELEGFFTKDEVIAEASKQYFEYNVDGTAVWHLPTYLNYNPAPTEYFNGTWNIEFTDNIPYITETFTYGITNYGGGYNNFADKAIEKPLFLYSTPDRTVKYQFSGQSYVDDGIVQGYASTGNYWEIHAVYKLVEA